MNTPQVLILQHTDTTTPGSVPSLLAAAGISYRVGQLHRGFTLPAPGAHELVVVCGGGVHVHQEDAHPFLKPEKEFLRREIERGTKLIGLCLGAQLIATVLGARCAPHPEGWEVGWHEIECLATPGLAGFERAEVRRVSQYHRYVFDLPDGARVIARNEWCATQAFAYRDHVLAFGFHPERTLTSNAEIAREAELPTTGRTQMSSEMSRLGAECEPRVRPWFTRVLLGHGGF